MLPEESSDVLLMGLEHFEGEPELRFPELRFFRLTPILKKNKQTNKLTDVLRVSASNNSSPHPTLSQK